ncbi:MAG TPA: hypothetical protein VGY99_08350 [Candidatus Binataceae bacterium]|jgi:hypothetical protein|nr:hypothetical protein [Candidatus Binataceae bacterium]
MKYTALESEYLNRIRARLVRLRAYLNQMNLNEASQTSEWYQAVAKMRSIQGNISNDLSFLACLLAKSFLNEHFGVTNFDAAAKPQGAPGLDIDVETPRGERLIAEIKTTVPYTGALNDLGAQQKSSFRKDFAKLNGAQASHKLLFVTDRATFDVLQRRYLGEIPNVRVVLLDLTSV